MDTQYDVFLSYNRQDRDAVHQLATYLNHETDLIPWFDEWALIPGDSWIDDLQEGLQAAKSCAVFVGKSGQGPWQAKEVHGALQQQTKKQSFRVIPVLLPEAPERVELPLFLQGLNWVDFQNGLDDDDALWKLECGIRGIPPGNGRSKAPDNDEIQKANLEKVTPIVLPPPGGALALDSEFYIPRAADQEVFQAIGLPRSIVTVRAPRQFGKTTLISRAYHHATEQNDKLKTVFIDFQFLTNQVDSIDSIWLYIAGTIAHKLKLDHWMTDEWDSDLTYQQNFTDFLERFVLTEENDQLLIGLDEVDRLVNSPIRNSFFGAIRAFYNQGAIDPVWKRVRWIIGVSSEPEFFIEDLNQSPFNVGIQVELEAFFLDDIQNVSQHFANGTEGLTVATSPNAQGKNLDWEFILKLLDFCGGHPFLFHTLLYQSASKSQIEKIVLNDVSIGQKKLWGHLKRFLILFQKDAPLKKAMLSVIQGNGCDDYKLADRLQAAGLARLDKTFKVVPFCPLYQTFFETKLQ